MLTTIELIGRLNVTFPSRTITTIDYKRCSSILLKAN
jgi:hypothetical protein